jgi:hypothetical protein
VDFGGRKFNDFIELKGEAFYTSELVPTVEHTEILPRQDLWSRNGKVGESKENCLETEVSVNGEKHDADRRCETWGIGKIGDSRRGGMWLNMSADDHNDAH